MWPGHPILLGLLNNQSLALLGVDGDLGVIREGPSRFENFHWMGRNIPNIVALSDPAYTAEELPQKRACGTKKCKSKFHKVPYIFFIYGIFFLQIHIIGINENLNLPTRKFRYYLFCTVNTVQIMQKVGPHIGPSP